MKIGWLLFDDEYGEVEFFTEEPESWRGGRIVQIVYAEVVK
jgi:hypothetical protein